MAALLKGRGFTLLELLIVIVIVGVLAAIALPQYNKAVERSRMAGALVTMKSLRDTLDEEILYGMNNQHLDYIGGDEAGREVLSARLNCNFAPEDERCYVKNFSYRVWCSEVGCFVSAIRNDTPAGEDLYALLWRKVLTDWNDYPKGVWEGFCMAHSDLGWTLCEGLARRDKNWQADDERYAHE